MAQHLPLSQWVPWQKGDGSVYEIVRSVWTVLLGFIALAQCELRQIKQFDGGAA